MVLWKAETEASSRPLADLWGCYRVTLLFTLSIRVGISCVLGRVCVCLWVFKGAGVLYRPDSGGLFFSQGRNFFQGCCGLSCAVGSAPAREISSPNRPCPPRSTSEGTGLFSADAPSLAHIGRQRFGFRLKGRGPEIEAWRF